MTVKMAVSFILGISTRKRSIEHLMLIFINIFDSTSWKWGVWYAVFRPSFSIVTLCVFVCFSCTSALPFPLHLSFCNIKCCHSIIETAAFFRQPRRMACYPCIQRQKRECKIGGWMQTFFLAERADHGCHCGSRQRYQVWRQIHIHIGPTICTMRAGGQMCTTTAAATPWSPENSCMILPRHLYLHYCQFIE